MDVKKLTTRIIIGIVIGVIIGVLLGFFTELGTIVVAAISAVAFVVTSGIGTAVSRKKHKEK